MRKELIDSNPLLKLSIEFSISVVEYCEVLYNQKKFALANQLIRSGTSIGANAMEAQNPESKADFIHKLSISLKEANETEYWIELLLNSGYIKKENYDETISSLKEILRLLISIIKTSKQNR